VKKNPFIDPSGKYVKPEEPNGVKLETFVFDAIPMAKHSVILETSRQKEFAPVKNATGVDSAEVRYQMMIDRAAAWLEAAGIDVPRKADGSPDCVLEMASSFALSAEDIKAKVGQVPKLTTRCEVYLD
jgi:UDP-N-acetylglucosamine/UDP-N-acetylgalactosamine diphosphorylase